VDCSRSNVEDNSSGMQLTMLSLIIGAVASESLTIIRPTIIAKIAPIILGIVIFNGFYPPNQDILNSLSSRH
jgi:hypothetical protein